MAGIRIRYPTRTALRRALYTRSVAMPPHTVRMPERQKRATRHAQSAPGFQHHPTRTIVSSRKLPFQPARCPVSEGHKSKLENIQDEPSSVFHEIRNGKIWFSEEVLKDHLKLRISLWRYLRDSRFFVALTAPFIYACMIPFVLLDLFVSVY